jgi:hypothetical protein
VITKRKVAMPEPKPGQHGAEIIKRLERNINGNRRAWQVFEDFLEIAERGLLDQPMHLENVAAGLPISECEETIAVWEKLFQWYPRKDEDAWQNFTEAYILLVHAAEIAQRIDSTWDVVGEVFMEFGAPSSWQGQFFTPWSVAKMGANINHDDTLLNRRMVEAARRVSKAGGAKGAMFDSMAMMLMSMGDEAKDAKTSEWFDRWFLPTVTPYVEPVTVYDCACGSGVMLLATASMFPAWANRYGLVRYYGQDIDHTCVRMARVNMMLHGLNGYALKCEVAALRGAKRKAGVTLEDLDKLNQPAPPIPSGEISPIYSGVAARSHNGHNGALPRADIEVNWKNIEQLGLFA